MRGAALSVGLAVVLLMAPGAARASQEELPIFDAHLHYSRDAWGIYSVDEIFDLLDEAGVYRAFVSSTPDEGTLRLHARDPRRIVLNLRPYRVSGDLATWAHDPSVVPYLTQRLDERR